MIMSANYAVLGLGMALAGPVTDAVGARWVYAGSAVLAGCAAVVGRVLTRRLAILGGMDGGAQPVSA